MVRAFRDVVDGPGVPAEEAELQLAQAQETGTATGAERHDRSRRARRCRRPPARWRLLLLGGVASASLGLRLLRKSS